MDSEYFSNYMEKPGEFFIRNVDDYLFVTTEPERVSQLARIMKKGMGTYNCYFNKEKSQNNAGSEFEADFRFFGMIRVLYRDSNVLRVPKIERGLVKAIKSCAWRITGYFYLLFLDFCTNTFNFCNEFLYLSYEVIINDVD